LLSLVAVLVVLVMVVVEVVEEFFFCLKQTRLFQTEQHMLLWLVLVDNQVKVA
jgi:hypothetical protein